MIYFIVPCGAAKVAHAAPARALYTGSAFTHALAAAETEAAATVRDLGVPATVLILSALHGLVDPEAVIEPYDVKMGDPASIPVVAIAAQMIERGIVYGPDEIYTMLPKAYRAAINAAAEIADAPFPQDVYEAAPGIGYQRGVGSSLIRSAEKGWVA